MSTHNFHCELRILINDARYLRKEMENYHEYLEDLMKYVKP